MTLPQLGSFVCLTFCTAIGASPPGLAYGDLFAETLRPAKYRHCEYEQFGYRPTYCAGSSPSFDKQGRPYIIVNYPFAQEEPPQSAVPGHFRELMICSEQGWRFVDLQTVLSNHLGDNHFGDDHLVNKGVLTSYSKKVEFIDETDEMFLLVQYQMQSGGYALSLLTSPDYGWTFAVTQIGDEYDSPFNRIATEHYAGHNRITWPMLVVTSRRRREPTSGRFSDYPGFLYYHILDNRGGRVAVTDSGELSDMASRNPIGSMYVTSAIASTSSRIHVAWHETSFEPGKVRRWGNKTYINTYDQVERKWIGKRYIGPSADDHGFPAVAMDSRGFLHVICGSHSDVVYYTRSKQPNDAAEFKPLMKIPGVARATHLSFVCDHADTLHLFYRDNEHDESGCGGLSYVRGKDNGGWRSVKRVASSPQRGYCRMCNALSIDKRGRLFLNYGYFTLDYRKEGKVGGWYYPVLAYSRDGGSTWGLAPNDFGLGKPRRAK